MKLHKIAFVLLIVGGLNWGLELFGVGVGNYVGATVAKVVYALVALSAIYEALGHKGLCKSCGGQMPM